MHGENLKLIYSIVGYKNLIVFYTFTLLYKVDFNL